MVLKESLKEAREKIIKQGKIAQYLKQTGIFPPMATYLISTGEETGKLDAMLISVGDTYEKDLTEYADSLTTLLGPVMTLATAGIVGFIVLGIMMPIMQMSSMVK
jgi:type II secretory pathway component PulF